MELQLKHLSSYLPYKTQIKTRYEIMTMVYTNEYYGKLKDENPNPVALSVVFENHYQMILKPFQDYSEINEITDEMNDYEIQMIEDNPSLIERLPFDVIEKMLKNHIDIFGLINFGIATSIHDVAQAGI